MESVDLKIHFKMEDLANVIRVLMHTLKVHAVPLKAGVVTLMHTAPVLDVLTSGNVEPGVAGMLGVHAQHHVAWDPKIAQETFLVDSHAMVAQRTHKFVQVRLTIISSL